MTDFLKLGPLDAVKWFDQNRDTLGVTDAAETIERLLAVGITDTGQMLEFAALSVLDDLEAVPGLAPTPANLRKLAVVGPDVMREDPDNVDGWMRIAGRFCEPSEDAYDLLGAFLKAGRAPSFAWQVLELIERANEGWAHTQRGRILWEVDYLDLTLPYAELVDMVEGGITADTRKAWAEAGFDLADTIALTASGLDLARISVLKQYGVPREEWAKYVPIPQSWFDETPRGYGSSREHTAKGLPEGYDLDLLLTMAAKGFEEKMVDIGASGRRRGRDRQYLMPWQIFAVRQVQDLTRAQVERLLAAGLTNMTATKYYTESRSGVGADRHKAPGPLLTYARDMDEWPTVDELLDWWIKLAEAGIRPSHLSEYRWVGCTTYQQILDVVAAGITPKRAKELRTEHGVKTGYQVNDTLRIRDWAELLAFHNADTAAAAAGGQS